MNKLINYLSKLDWTVAFGTVAYGLFSQDALIILVGSLGLCLAWYRPADRVKAKLEKYFLAKKRIKDDSAKLKAQEDFYAQALGESSAEQSELVAEGAVDADPTAPAAPEARPLTFARGFSAYASVRLSSSRHNRLTPQALNLSRSIPADWS